jgi:hypothetical protein
MRASVFKECLQEQALHFFLKILQVMVNGDDEGANIHALYRNISMRFQRKLHNQHFEHTPVVTVPTKPE